MIKTKRRWLHCAIAAFSLLGLADQAYAGRAIEVTYFYYNDDTHLGPIVGQTTAMCGSRGTISTGHATPYIVDVEVSCTGDSPNGNAYNALPTIYHHCEPIDPYAGAFRCYD